MCSSPSPRSSVAATFPDWLPPRTMLGAPMTICWPCSTAALAAGTVVGNSAMRAPRATDSATCSGVASSWAARGMPRSVAKPAIARRWPSE